MSVKRNTSGKIADGPRRSPAGGGYERGEQARAQIIATALRVFAEEGYARATTRRIAAEAGVNPPALQYYFGSKEGLHTACAETMVEQHSAMFGAHMETARSAIGVKHASESAEAVARLLDALFRPTLDAEGAPDWAKFLSRTESDAEGPGFAIARERIHAPLFAICARLCADAMNRTHREPEPIAMTLFLMNMLSSFSVHQGSGLAALNWTKLTPARRQILRATFRSAVLGALKAQSDGM